jgi:DNA repair protein RadC
MASSIIVCHNHPSGNTKPSAEDIEITNRLKEAGELMGIQLLDHIIISKNGYYSFSTNNAL